MLRVVTCSLLLSLAASAVGCSDYSIRNARIHPTYVCSGDNIQPYATWEYSGPKGKVRITTHSDEVLCEAGARAGYCPFARGLTSNDIPLKAKAYKGGDKKGEEQVNYVVLSGPTPTDSFLGSFEFSEPYEKCVETKVTHTDGTVETRRDCFDVVATNQVAWPIHAGWFSPLVQTRSVQYTRGDRAITLSGPGLSTPTPLNVNNATAGNNAHPGGLWIGAFTPDYERRVSGLDYQPDFRLTLTVACQ